MKGRPFAKQREADRRRFEAQEKEEKEKEGRKDVADYEGKAGNPLSDWLASAEEGTEPPGQVLRFLTGNF